MTDRELNRLFERFRTRGDTQALARVFDRVAPELVRVATGWVVSGRLTADDVEDLVQDTLVTAIERSERYDAARRLVPWLVGILVMHAHEWRRDGRREIDPADLPARVEPTPDERLDASELAGAIDAALAAATERERRELDLYLREGRSPSAIARERGERPGAVRMRIRRGLARLRAALPAGVAFGGAMSLTGRRGWADVRAAVLERGREVAEARGLAAASSAPATLVPILGALAVNKLLVVAVLGVILAATWWAVPSSEPRPLEPVTTARAAPSTEPVALATPRSAPDVARSRDAAPSVAEREAVDPVSAEPSSPLARELHLAAMTGRVVESDGRPVPDLELALFELGAETFAGLSVTDALAAESVDPGLVVHSTRTDDEGRFLLARATPRTAHFLAVDPGGPRAEALTLPASLAPGATSELGDVVLSAPRPVRGVVRSPDGAPVAGARVRLASGVALPYVSLLAGARASTRLLPNLGVVAAPTVFELPAWSRALLDRAPFPTAHTDERGAFELAAPESASRWRLVVDHPGYPVKTLELQPADRTIDLAVELRHGRSIAGVVVDADGRPVESAHVVAGAGTRELVLLQPAASTDAAGRFLAEGLDEEGDVFVAARRDAASAWVVTEVEGETEARIVLDEGNTLVVRVTDPDGAPVEGARARLDAGGALALTTVRALLERTEVPADWNEASPGVLRASNVTGGSYALFVDAPGFALAGLPVRIDSDEQEVEISLARARPLEVRVTEAGSGRPVPDALVSLHGVGFGACATAGTSDASGVARLEGIPSGETVRLRVSHPGFAPAHRELTERELEEARIDVELGVGGSLVARRRVNGLVGGEPWVLALQPDDPSLEPDHEVVVQLRADDDGVVRTDRLAPGVYSAWVSGVAPSGASAFDGSLLAGRTTARRIDVRAGETTELELGDAMMTRPGDRTLLTGTVTLDGMAGAGLQLVAMVLSGGGVESYSTSTDATGAFAFDDMSGGEVTVTVFRSPSGAWKEDIMAVGYESTLLRPGREHELAIELESRWLDVLVTSGGVPVEGAKVTVTSVDTGDFTFDMSGASSDGDGRARLAVAGPGTQVVTAHASEHGFARRELEWSADATVTLEVSPGVPFEGRVRATDLEPGDRDAWLVIADEELPIQQKLRLEDGEARFRLVGVPPGEHEAVLHVDGDSHERRLHFELPPAGATNVDLEFDAP